MLLNSLLKFLLLAASGQAITLFPSPGAIPTSVPAACRAMLVQNITCANNLVTPDDIESGSALYGNLSTEYCTSDCYDSLHSFQTNVDNQCGDKLYKMFPNSSFEQSGASLAYGLNWAYDVSCIKDSTGFCLYDLLNGTKSKCSGCMLKYAAAMVSSDWGRRIVNVDSYSSLLSSCSADPASYTYSYTSMPVASATVTSTIPAATATCTGSAYTVKSGDTCESISENEKVATDRMINLNHLDYDCSSLSSGMTLCIQDTCSLATVQQNQTCSSILKGQDFSIIQLISWNPSLYSDCSNIDSMVGRSLCISPPGSSSPYINTTMPSPSRASLNSTMFSSWVTGTASQTYSNFTTSWYTPTLNASAIPTSTVVPNATYASLMSERQKYCWLTDSQWDIPEDEYPDGCQNLLDEYCFVDIDDPVPSSPAHIPAVCTPTGTDYTPTPWTSTATASPSQSSAILTATSKTQA